MKSLHLTTVILLLVLIVVEAQIEVPTCGLLLPVHNPLMTNSFPTRHWPWQAAIFHRLDNDVPKYQCGGTVINSNWILTAGICVSKYERPMETAQISVSLGRFNLDVKETSAQDFEVAEIVLHPNYTSVNYNNDIAVIRLSTHATFNNYVRPVCLWPSNKLELSEVIGKAGTVIGWGKTEKGELSNVLRQANMPVVSYGNCLKIEAGFFGHFLSGGNFCAGLLNGTSVCRGDAGGSMTFEENGIYYIRGIVSFGRGIVNKTIFEIVCDSSLFAIFTDVAQYLPWIDDTISNSTMLRDGNIR